MTANQEEEIIFAEPGDPDLTCNIQNTTITSVVSFNDDEVMITFSGGSGLLTVDGDPQQWDNFEQIELVGGFFSHPENAKVIKMMVDVLEEWRRNGTKLNILSAPGKMTTVVEDRENWLPIPCGTVGT